MEREWKNISSADYHALDALGSSAIKCFAVDGQLEFYARYIAKTKERKETDAMRLGRAFHAAMEDENGWESRYAKVPTSIEDDEFVEAINKEFKERRSKSEPLVVGVPYYPKFPTHRAYMDAHKLRAEREGKDFIDQNEIDVVHRQVEAVYDNQACRDLLQERTGLASEVACVSHHECGEDVKALIDRSVSNGFIDFKKTCEGNPYNFLRDAFRRHYDFQLGHYAFVTDKEWAALISVNDTAPFEAHAWEVPKSLLLKRKQDAERALLNIAQLRKGAAIDTLDSQGIPLSYHNELWGALLPLDMDELIRRHSEIAA